MTPFRLFFSTLVLLVSFAIPVAAQDADRAGQPAAGSQTLESILARQQGLQGADPLVDTPESLGTAAPATAPLGTLGGASDPALWRALREGSADVLASASTPGSTLLMQDGGITWLQIRAGPLRTYGGYALLATLAVLTLFFLVRGRIQIEAGPAGSTIVRFRPIERFGHWLVAGSFILLAVTGLTSLFGRVGLLPYIGHENYSLIATGSKWVHNNVSWAFMLGLVMIFVMWVVHNLPDRHDANWLIRAGGLLSKHSHPPARKFNAGQKLVFWSVIVLGASISLSGLSLLFPFQLPLFFSKTFAILNDLGIPGWFDAGPLPTVLAPQEELQLAQLWHSIVAFVLMVIIIGHIYIGSLGMHGAYAAMGDGAVDLNWAREHHSLWVEEVQAKADAEAALRAPAE